MKAFVVERYGKEGPRAADVAMPAISAQDVLVEVRAASINPLDKMVRNGELKQLIKYHTPFVLGHDVAGVITKVGAGVRDFKAGDEVFARPRDGRIGTFAEYIAIDADDVALKPAKLSFAEAAAVPLVSLAAWQILVEKAQIKPGQKVLVHGGAGGLGSTVIQLAKYLGAHVATTARRSAEQTVRDLGADEVIDFTEQDFSQILSGYDLVIDGIGGENLMKSLTVLKPGGLAVGVSSPPDAAFARQMGLPKPLEWVLSFRSRKVRKAAAEAGVHYSFFLMRASGSQLRELAALYDAGDLRPVIDNAFPFDQTTEAMAFVETGKTKAGKVVITLD